jgi:hypothetical protein
MYVLNHLLPRVHDADNHFMTDIQPIGVGVVWYPEGDYTVRVSSLSGRPWILQVPYQSHYFGTHSLHQYEMFASHLGST